MRERGALGQAGGAAGVLQKNQIVSAHRYRRARQARAFLERVGQGHRAGEARVNRRAGQRHTRAVSWCHGDDRLDPGLAQHLGQRRGRAAEDHDGLAARIVELVLQFTRGVKRVHVHLDGAGPQDAQAGDGEGDEVRTHHGDTVALLHAELVLQPGRECGGLAVHVGIGQHLAEGAEGGLVGEGLHGFIEQGYHGGVGVGVDGGGDAVFAVGGEPGLLMHGESS